MFSQDFGTTILEDKIARASKDPGRHKSILNQSHIDRAKIEDVKKRQTALEIASKRANSI